MSPRSAYPSQALLMVALLGMGLVGWGVDRPAHAQSDAASSIQPGAQPAGAQPAGAQPGSSVQIETAPIPVPPTAVAPANNLDAWGNWEARPSRPAYSVHDVQSRALQEQVEAPSPVSGIRAQALQEQALEFGAQSGLAARSREIKSSLSSRARDYDKVFRFDVAMLEPGLLPPVINEGRDAYEQTGTTKVRAASRIYTIEFPARLVNTPPKWQEYLDSSQPDPRLPHPSLLPRDKDEQVIWDRWVATGWEQGVKQADQMFEGNLARLQRDFEGMLRYKKLYEQGLVTAPVMATSRLGVTGGGSEMAIDDRIYEITVPANLDPNTRRWRRQVPVTHAADLPAGSAQ
jgi:defect-in-organelle-trafficking protein DotC